MAGFTAENVIKGLLSFCDWDLPDRDENVVLLDVREDAERMAYELPNSTDIPLGELRDRLGELDPEKTYITFCAIGVRSYNAARILMQNGFNHVMVYPGGVRFYESLHREKDAFASFEDAGTEAYTNHGVKEFNMDNMKELSLDCCGMQCPGPIMEVYRNIESMDQGDILKVRASDPGFSKDIVSWCRRTGNTLLSNEKDGVEYVACIQKGMEAGRRHPG